MKLMDFLLVPILTACMLLLGLFVILSFNDYNSKNDYSYIDTSGDLGFADYCNRDRGQLYCRAGDKTIEVKEFTKKEEE